MIFHFFILIFGSYSADFYQQCKLFAINAIRCRGDTIRSALEVLAVCTVIPKAQLLLCEQIRQPDADPVPAVRSVTCFPIWKAKGMFNYYSVTVAAYTVVTFRVGVQPRLQPNPTVTHLWPVAISSHSLPFNVLYLHNPYKYIDYYSFTDPGSCNAELALLADP